MLGKAVARLAVVGIAWTFALASPAGAITFGQPDNGAHPNVAAIVGDLGGTGEQRPFCSGTLISSTVVLTAGHCTDALATRGIGTHDVWVSFDDDARSSNPQRTLLRGRWTTDPAYGYSGQGGKSDPHDMGVVVLDAAVAGRSPGTLPSAGELDAMRLKDARFIAVGYGERRDAKTGGPNALEPGGVRYWTEQGFNALRPAWLELSMNPSTGSGGTCYGDSGGPHFAVATGKLVSITATGDSQCRATDTTYRLDTASARSFLGRFVPLP